VRLVQRVRYEAAYAGREFMANMMSQSHEKADDDDEFIPPGAKHLKGTVLFTSQSVHTPQ
jgi:hypothetical protein